MIQRDKIKDDTILNIKRSQRFRTNDSELSIDNSGIITGLSTGRTIVRIFASDSGSAMRHSVTGQLAQKSNVRVQET